MARSHRPYRPPTAEQLAIYTETLHLLARLVAAMPPGRDVRRDFVVMRAPWR